MEDELKSYDDSEEAIAERKAAEADPSALDFKETADYEKGFAAYYAKELLPYVRDMEAKRTAMIEETRRRKRSGYPLAVAMAVGGLALTAAVAVANGDPSAVLVFSLVAVWATVNWVHAPGVAFEAEEKQELFPRALRFFGDFRWEENGRLDIDSVRKTLIVPAPDDSPRNFSVTDKVSGVYKGMKMELARVETGQGSGKSHTDLFAGDLILVELPRKFTGKTVIRTGLDPSTARTVASTYRLEPVDLENGDFEKRIQVFSDDQVEARVLLTPDVMDSLLTLVNQPDTEALRCSFVEQTLCIAFQTYHRLFPTDADAGFGYEIEDLHRFVARMHHVLAMVDALSASRS